MKTLHPVCPFVAAACAVRAVFESQIAKSWDDHFAQQREAEHTQPTQGAGYWLTAYRATLLVNSQSGGRANSRSDYRKASRAVSAIMPELLAEFWALQKADWEAVDRTVTL